ncbi:MAG TPA: slipin family protein [Syntrophomonadaceae bacterium]|nr:slipin family protein [Syntrophomonadaceae bacterium]
MAAEAQSNKQKVCIRSINSDKQNRRGKSLGLWLFLLFLVIGIVLFYKNNHNIFYLIVFAGIGYAIGNTVKIAHEWQRAVVLRLGRFHKLAGPGLFFCIPVIDHVTIWIDQRMFTTYFEAEKTLTRDNVPVDVDAVLFWMVWDAQKAALEVEDFNSAVTWAAQTALRDIIGKTELSEMLTGRERLDEELQKIIDERTEDWGITVQSVEIRDVVIPPDLQDVMSREAQAERERRARKILGQAEREIANNFLEAAQIYGKNEIAFKLRSMNLLYESVKERGGLVVVPGGFNDPNTASLLGMLHYNRMPGLENEIEDKENGN